MRSSTSSTSRADRSSTSPWRTVGAASPRSSDRLFPDLALLQRDTLTFESPLSYDGGRDGTALLRRVLADSPRFLRRGGALLLELGGEEAEALGDDLERASLRRRRRPP